MQNCEFGLALLASRKWLAQRGKLDGEIKDERRITDLVIHLLQDGVTRLTTASLEWKGGELKESQVFFRGDPYTSISERRAVYSSANLDAAMLILGFFAGALEAHDQAIARVDLTAMKTLHGLGVRTLRDAALLICREALRYALACRFEVNGQFQGFACDPTSTQAGLLNDYDRLFFTWTTCETLHELLELSDWAAYLERVQVELADPRLATETRDLLLALEHDLSLASDWCLATFLGDFRKLDAPPIDVVVKAFAPLGEIGQPDPDIKSKAVAVGDYVRNVYSISQYAAIRSIAPTKITIPEVRDILNLLQSLVETHILGSGLDEAVHPLLYQTLTRYYSLGNSNRKEYEDDAYFPLVVRSLSGLLARTITQLGEAREPVLILVAEFRKSLHNLCKTMAERRPQDKEAESGDDLLWSVASSRPFLLYATQRTIFALLAYKDFLVEMERYENSPSPNRPAATVEEQLRDALAQSLASALFGPVVEMFMRKVGPLPAPGRTAGAESGRAASDSTFPQASWAREILLDWLRGLVTEFDSQIESALLQDASSLVELRSRIQVAEQSAPNGKLTLDMQRVMNNLLTIPRLRSLHESGQWEEDSILRALGEHLLHATLPQGTLRERMQEVPLWSTISDAKAKIEAHNRKPEGKR